MELVFWFWWMLAIGFLVIEILVTGFFFLWLALSAFVVGVILWLSTAIAAEVQFLLFSILAVVSVLSWRHYARKRKPPLSDHPLLNQRAAQYIGRTFNLVAAIENGHGKIMVDGTLWTVHGKDSPAGSRVKVIAAQGTVLEVIADIEA